MKSLLWLASYPKSGNTWLRAFLSNYIWDPAEPVPVNDLGKLGTTDSATEFYMKLARGRLDVSSPVQTTSLREPFPQPLQRVSCSRGPLRKGHPSVRLEEVVIVCLPKGRFY